MTIICGCGEKGVVVAVYAEKAASTSRRRRRRSQGNRGRRGYNNNNNRRAELLDYARHLRASAAPAPAPASSDSISHKKQISKLQQPKQGACSPGCLGNWQFFQLPTLFKGKNRISTTTKIKSLLQVGQKRGGFISKLFATMWKRH